ncbi:MAG TPA: DUF885 domain-containing protein [Gammaproteobacteria bacterium]|nr:DUF885 domain-containing protein [Gammaproteobacteria bacterium]
MKTINTKILALMLVLALAACGNQNPPAETTEPEVSMTESDKLNEWFEVKYEEELMMSPIGLTFLGRKERYDEIDDMTEAAEDEQLEWKRQTVEEMKASFDYAALTDDAKLSYNLWAHQYEQSKNAVPFRRNDYVFTQMQGIHTFLPTLLLSFHKVEEVSDMDALISRVSGVGVAMNQLVDRAKLGAEEGVRPPRFSYEIVTTQAQDVISGAPFDDSETDSSLWGGIKGSVAALQEAGDIDEAQANAYLESAKTALIDNLKPSYENLISFMQADIANTSEEAQGASALPNGDAYYANQLAIRTTTDMTADEVHQLGLSEVTRIRAEMEELKQKAGFEGTLQEYFTYIRDNKDSEEHYYPNTDEGRQGYIDDATAAIENIKLQLPKYFGILPKADLEVKRVEPFREQDGAPQHYFSGTPDGSRAGIYYAHLSDMTAMPKNELEVIAYHEGLPGHHMQISIAQELTGVPTFRTQAGSTAYIEGWALYSEKLAKEMPSTYVTINSDFGRLGSEIWRAIRLVVDSGMHSKGWTEDEAVEYFSQNSPAPLETIRTEVQRYLVWPGQATSYKVGMIFIQDLREAAEKELGDRFDIGGFHDAVLDGGALPLSMLKSKVERWVADEKAKA